MRPEALARLDTRASEIGPAREEREPRFHEPEPASRKRLRRGDLAREEREPAECRHRSAIARAQAQVRRRAGGHLQRLDLLRVAIRVVDDGELRPIGEAPARGAQPPREVHVLAVHEDVRVESADVLEGDAAQQHRRAARPWRLERQRVVGLRMLVRDLPELPRRDLARLLGGRAHEAFEHAGLEHAILVEHEEERRLAERGVGVVAAAEADILVGDRDDHARECFVEARARHRAQGAREVAVGAVIVDEEVAAHRLERGLGEALDETAELVEIGMKGDDADVDLGDVGGGARERARREARQFVEGAGHGCHHR